MTSTSGTNTGRAFFEEAREISGDIDFALLLNKGWGVLGFPYARVKHITVKDMMYIWHDDGSTTRSC